MPPTIDSDKFTIAVFQDTQYYSELGNGIFGEMAQWVADKQSTYNIETFWHGGDIVQNFGNNPGEWDIAEAAIQTITEAGITPVISTGNHDTEEMHERGWATYRDRFGSGYLQNQYDGDSTVVDWGTYEGYAENQWVIQEINGREFIWLTTEYAARDAVMDWALQTFDDHLDKTGAYICHSYINYNDEYGTDTSHVNSSDANSGLEQWEGWIRKTANVDFETGGHYHSESDFNGRLQKTTDPGNQITQMHMNYQSLNKGQSSYNGGDGWLRLLTVDTAKNSVEATTYSPHLDQWDDSTSTKFTFDISAPPETPTFAPTTIEIYNGESWESTTAEVLTDGAWSELGISTTE